MKEKLEVLKLRPDADMFFNFPFGKKVYYITSKDTEIGWSEKNEKTAWINALNNLNNERPNSHT